MNIKNQKMLNLGILVIIEHVETHYHDLSEEDYFLLDSLKKEMIKERNKLKNKKK